MTMGNLVDRLVLNYMFTTSCASTTYPELSPCSPFVLSLSKGGCAPSCFDQPNIDGELVYQVFLLSYTPPDCRYGIDQGAGSCYIQRLGTANAGWRGKLVKLETDMLVAEFMKLLNHKIRSRCVTDISSAERFYPCID